MISKNTLQVATYNAFDHERRRHWKFLARKNLCPNTIARPEHTRNPLWIDILDSPRMAQPPHRLN
jgi:uncharacterized protein VirK/YbjX